MLRQVVFGGGWWHARHRSELSERTSLQTRKATLASLLRGWGQGCGSSSTTRTAAMSSLPARLRGHRLEAPLHTPPHAGLSSAIPPQEIRPCSLPPNSPRLLANLSALNLQPNTAAQILAAVL